MHRPRPPQGRNDSHPAESDGTRQRLLEIAEQLFADLGVENTPLQRIVEESGQRNRSVLNYHFGSRRDLLSCLLDLRLQHLNALRHQQLDTLEAAGMAGDAAMIARAAFQPLLDVILDQPWGPRYIQVLAQTVFNPALAAHELISPEHTAGMRRARDLLAAALPDLPFELLVARLVWASDVVVHSLARWCREQAPVWESAGPLDDMFDFVISGLTGPVSLGADQRRPLVGAGPAIGLARWLGRVEVI